MRILCRLEFNSVLGLKQGLFFPNYLLYFAFVSVCKPCRAAVGCALLCSVCASGIVIAFHWRKFGKLNFRCDKNDLILPQMLFFVGLISVDFENVSTVTCTEVSAAGFSHVLLLCWPLVWIIISNKDPTPPEQTIIGLFISLDFCLHCAESTLCSFKPALSPNTITAPHYLHPTPFLHTRSLLHPSNKQTESPGSVRGPVLVVANGNRRDFADRAWIVRVALTCFSGPLWNTISPTHFLQARHRVPGTNTAHITIEFVSIHLNAGVKLGFLMIKILGSQEFSVAGALSNTCNKCKQTWKNCVKI